MYMMKKHGLALTIWLAFVILLGWRGCVFIASRHRCEFSRLPRCESQNRAETLAFEAEVALKKSIRLRLEAKILESERKRHHLERQQLEKQRIFDELANQQTGVGAKELIKFFGNGVSTEHAQKVLEFHVLDKNGLLSFEEFEPDRLRQALRYVQSGDRVLENRLAILKEQWAAKQHLLDTLPVPNTDFGMQALCLSVLPYLVPLLSATSVEAREYPTAIVTLLGYYSFELLNFWTSWHWTLLLLMSFVANKRKLPLILRFNLQQAFTLDLLLMLGDFLSSWIQGPAQHAHVSLLGQVVNFRTSDPAIGLQVLIFCALGCIAYSVLLTLLSRVPDGIPFISAEARKSLGKMRPLTSSQQRQCRKNP
eukprot:TRINITY_DN17494_c0_g2_i1.p1 TRINITY_DN17494_c0_g2~~TRINITY_DN17494_c0_g2_i1.p1  ORF type:complete len:366 (-),score=50.21 TRINITY_DN17494_c0_g2_i1:243-1340(-)